MQAFCTSASRDSSLRQHSFLVCVLVTMMRGAFDTVVYQCLLQHIFYGQTIYIFMLWFVLSSSFFPRLISAAADWMSAILPHMVWP